MIRGVPVELGGQTRTLRFALSAWAALEDQGYQLKDIVAEAGTLSMKAVAACLWAMLQEEDPRPTLAQVRSWVDGENFAAVVQAMGQAMRQAFPAPPEGQGPPMASPAA